LKLKNTLLFALQFGQRSELFIFSRVTRKVIDYVNHLTFSVSQTDSTLPLLSTQDNKINNFTMYRFGIQLASLDNKWKETEHWAARRNVRT
jgi:hypothetical protein